LSFAFFAISLIPKDRWPHQNPYLTVCHRKNDAQSTFATLHQYKTFGQNAPEEAQSARKDLITTPSDNSNIRRKTG
jgi:hypothetical protein